MHLTGLIVKATRYCNLRCGYCHDWRSGPDQTMPFPVLARMIAGVLRDPEADRVEFIWHGGEITLLPIAFYEKAMILQSRFRRPGQVIHNQIQTNGTRLTPEWARFLRDNRFGVGVSLDGPPEIHDRQRRYASGRASFADVQRGLRLLEENRVGYAVLMVIDEEAMAIGPDRIFDFFLEQGIKSYGLLPARPTNQPDAGANTPTEHYVEPQRANAFFARMYDRWREHGDPTIQIRELASLEQRLAGRTPLVCTYAGGCLGKYYLVEPNGDVMHCDLFVGDDNYRLGNVLHDDFAAIGRSDKLQHLQRENAEALRAMSVCPEFPVCNGWCPHERYAASRHASAYTPTCCGLRPLIEHIRQRSAPATPLAESFA